MRLLRARSCALNQQIIGAADDVIDARDALAGVDDLVIPLAGLTRTLVTVLNAVLTANEVVGTAVGSDERPCAGGTTCDHPNSDTH